MNAVHCNIASGFFYYYYFNKITFGFQSFTRENNKTKKKLKQNVSAFAELNVVENKKELLSALPSFVSINFLPLQASKSINFYTIYDRNLRISIARNRFTFTINFNTENYFGTFSKWIKLIILFRSFRKLLFGFMMIARIKNRKWLIRRRTKIIFECVMPT